jgi:hypothetical protein
MDFIEVRCQKCNVKVGVMPGSVAWHCGVQMTAVDPEVKAPERPVGVPRRPQPPDPLLGW